MDFDALFREYSPTPRAPELAPHLHENVRKSIRGLLFTLLGSFVLGAPFSLIRFRKSRPWEPLDMLIVGAILAVFTVPIAAVVVVTLRKYRRLFTKGKLVEARVVQQRPMGVVMQVDLPIGPNLTYMPNVKAPVGARFPAIVGETLSSLTLVVVQRGQVERGSLLTVQQLGQVVGGQ